MYFDQTGLAMVGPTDGGVGMESEYIQTQCVLADGGDRFGVCALAFDQSEELLWMGNQGGHVTSYYGGGMQKYTSFQIHMNQDVRQIHTIDEGILCLTAGTLRMQMRRGIPMFTHTSHNMADMQCMLQISPHRLLMAGHQDKLIDFNMAVCKETNLIDVGETGCVMLRGHNRFVCAGDPVGRIDLRDPNTLNIEHTLDTHSGSLSDFDVQGNLLVTCGFSSRQGNLSVDRFLMVYDLRMMRAVSPIQTILDPLYLRFLPSVSSRLAVVSTLGQAQLVDTVALSEPRLCLLQMESPGAMCLAFDISTTSQALAFGDNAGSIHLFAATHEPMFNSFSRVTEHADHVASFPSFAIDDYETPLSVVPMSIISHEIPLASDWPPQLLQRTYRKAPPIDPDILRTMKMQGPIGYAPNPKTTKRNQVIYNLEKAGSKSQFKQNLQDNRSVKNVDDGSGNFVAIPKRYRKLDMKYNKLGTEEFQMDQYNKTGFPGLESMLPNAYCNSMIQVLFYCEPLRAALLSHVCSKEFCLSCELGFLFHMLLKAQGQPCQPGNFLRAFRTVPEASALGLILSDLHPDVKMKIDLSQLIQSWNCFIIHQMHVELLEHKKKTEEAMNANKPFVYKDADFPNLMSGERRRTPVQVSDEISNVEEEKKDEATPISNLFGMKQLHTNTCLKCGFEIRKESVLLACNLNYPTAEPERDEWPFCEILTRSLCPSQITPAWCDKCTKFGPTSHGKSLQSLPKILSINTGLNHTQNKLFWQSQMDKVVAKVVNNQNQDQASRSVTPNSMVGVSSKPCRYGDNCSRPGCRFRHNMSSTSLPQPPVNNPYCSNNWLPHQIRMTLTNKKLNIAKVGSGETIISHNNNNNDKDGAGKENITGSEEKSKSNSVPSTSAPYNPESDLDEKVLENRLYTLSAVVCYINDSSAPDKRNLVSLVKVPDYRDNDGSGDHREPKWYLFNDMCINPVPAHEAVWFSLDWKVPCVLYYSSTDIMNQRYEVKTAITKEVFTHDACYTNGITFTPLLENELPRRGELVAMDAEFVTLNQEEAELRSDGKMSTIKPSQMSVARITCIRGQGPNEGTPFIDDYISTQEQVVDYLTKFSGIKPGDLDANFSSKHLTTLKSTYLKLRYLQDNGVIFVGHGLKNDFRVINLVVPPEQVVDTVLLFRLPHHRMVSLRFLAWHFLSQKIQSETHDSTEDARAALQLYRKYKILEAQNKVGEALSALYEAGKKHNWKVPEDGAK